MGDPGYLPPKRAKCLLLLAFPAPEKVAQGEAEAGQQIRIFESVIEVEPAQGLAFPVDLGDFRAGSTIHTAATPQLR
ncbi:MAG: hypothetical protein R2724_23500 [Bryobacterales bacterium]